MQAVAPRHVCLNLMPPAIAHLWADSKPALHAVVVAYYQSRKRVCRLPSAARLNWHLHARQDSDAQDLPYSNLPRSLVAEDSRVYCHGSLPGAAGVALTTPYSPQMGGGLYLSTIVLTQVTGLMSTRK